MDILTLLKEPLFWIAPVIGGLFWNVLGNLITPYFQRLISRFYDYRNRNRILSLLEKRSRVERFFISYDDRDSTKLDVIHGLLRALGYMIIGTAIFIIASAVMFPLTYLLYIVGSFVLYLGVKVFDEQNLLLNQVRIAQERECVLMEWMERNNVAPSEQEKIDEFLISWDAKKFSIPEAELRSHLSALTLHSRGPLKRAP